MKKMSNGRYRRGAVALEFIGVIGMFLLAVLGMVEISRAVMVRQVIVNAAREATRRAVVPGATDADISGILTNYAEGAHMGGTWTPTVYVNGSAASLATAGSRDTVSVSVSVPFSQVSWGLMQFVPSSTTLAAQVTMRKE